jgi:hypothetical protein
LVVNSSACCQQNPKHQETLVFGDQVYYTKFVHNPTSPNLNIIYNLLLAHVLFFMLRQV